jgi:restriction system protein
MKSYNRVMLGRKSAFANECFNGQFIGAHFDIDEDLTANLNDSWRTFNSIYIPKFQARNPSKSKVVAGLACGAVWTIAKGLAIGDIVLCPDGSGTYRVGQIAGSYKFVVSSNLPHQRPVTWLSQSIARADMSEGLRNSTGSIGTVCNITGHASEIEALLNNTSFAVTIPIEEGVEDPLAFAMEKHLEDFLVKNWQHTEIGKTYDILRDEDELVGQQYQTDSGVIDILAQSKDKKKLLVIELKKGRASDVVLGQILRYMGYVKQELAEELQSVHGAIIALEDDLRIRRALSIVPSVEFFRYKIKFELSKS